MTRVGEQNSPLGLDLRAKDLTKAIHGISRVGDIVPVDIVRGEIALSAPNETVAGEIDQHAVILFGNGWKPLFEFVPQVRERRSRADDQVNIVGRKLASFRTYQSRVDFIGVAIGELQLPFLRKVLVAGDANDKRIAARDLDLPGFV